MSVSILVNSCDKYEKIWPTFFEMFYRFWPTCDFPVYLNTEKKEYDYNERKITVLHSTEKTWSARLLDCLNQIDSDYVITILDDFIFEEPVRTDLLEESILEVEKRNDVGSLQFVVGSEENDCDADYPLWKEQKKGQRYRINCQIAIWKKSYLKKILRKFESPWEFEKYGSLRSKKYKEKVYAWATESNYVFTYNWGKPIIGGKWNLDEVDRLEEKLEIKFDLSGREGMRDYYENLKKSPKPKRNLQWIIKKVRHIKSLI